MPQPTNNTIQYPDFDWQDNPPTGPTYTWLHTNYWNFYYSFSSSNIVRQSTSLTLRFRAPYNFPGPDSPKSYSSSGNQEDFILIKIRPKFLIDPYN